MKIAIDAGHGMSNASSGTYDSGATGGGVAEADVTLAWALTLKWVLAQNGFEVWMTRYDDDDAAPIGVRARRANRAGCDVYIAIHCNAAGPLATGTETLYRDAADKPLAEGVQRAALAATRLRNRGVKTEAASPHGRLAIFGFDGPAALVEIGFITNLRDRRRILDRDVRLTFARELTAWLKTQRP